MKTEKQLRAELDDIRKSVALDAELFREHSANASDLSSFWVFVFLLILGFVFSGLFLMSCTVTPVQVHSESYSWDQDSGKQDSGFEQFLADGSAEITPSAKARYDGLLLIYGKQLLVPVFPEEDGSIMLPDGNWRLDQSHTALFMRMQRAFKGGRVSLQPK